LLRSTHTQT